MTRKRNDAPVPSRVCQMPAHALPTRERSQQKTGRRGKNCRSSISRKETPLVLLAGSAPSTDFTAPVPAPRGEASRTERNPAVCAEHTTSRGALVRPISPNALTLLAGWIPIPAKVQILFTLFQLALARPRGRSGELASQVLICKRVRCPPHPPHGVRKVAEWRSRPGEVPASSPPGYV